MVRVRVNVVAMIRVSKVILSQDWLKDVLRRGVAFATDR